MNKLLGGVAISLFLAAPAMAADMPVKAPPRVAAVATVYNWTGFYTASGVGVSWWDIKGDYVNFVPDHHNTQASRFNYSSIVGAQYQTGNWVFGVEGAFNSLLDRDYASTNSISPDCLGSFGGGTADRTCLSRVRSLWTAGGRLGYAWDRFMVFGGGGFASGKVQTETRATSTGALLTATEERHGGWYAGGGAEMFLTKFWMTDVIFGLEYQHIDLGKERHVPANAPTEARDMRVTVDTVRARIVFKWTPAGPVVARY